MLTFIRYIELYLTFAFLDCVRYNDDFVTSSFCSVHFIVVFAALKKIVLYTEEFVMQKFVESMFYRICCQNIPFVSRNLPIAVEKVREIYTTRS